MTLLSCSVSLSPFLLSSHTVICQRIHVMVKAIAVMNFITLSIPSGSSSSSLNLTYLSNLIQQFVVFFPFLQGAQIATHSSCQGNSAECPLECVCCLQCVWALPGAEYTQAPLLLLPHTTFSSVYPQRSPTRCSNCRKHTHVSAQCHGRGCAHSSLSVCLWGLCQWWHE